MTLFCTDFSHSLICYLALSHVSILSSKDSIYIHNEWNLHRFLICSMLQNFVKALRHFHVTLMKISTHLFMWFKFIFYSDWVETIDTVVITIIFYVIPALWCCIHFYHYYFDSDEKFISFHSCWYMKEITFDVLSGWFLIFMV